LGRLELVPKPTKLPGVIKPEFDETHYDRQHELGRLEEPIIDARKVHAKKEPYEQSVENQQGEDHQSGTQHKPASVSSGVWLAGFSFSAKHGSLPSLIRLMLANH
jgi:hypothetical protein